MESNGLRKWLTFGIVIILVFVIIIDRPMNVCTEVNGDVKEEWVARYNGPGNYYDWGQAIITDSAGNVYMTGYSWGSGSTFDYCTIAYDSYGNELWMSRYNGPGNNVDVPNAIAIDQLGNLYVTGRSLGIGTHTDFATVAYDSLGNELWVAIYDGPGYSADYAYAISVDSTGNVYITGYTFTYDSETMGDFATVAYDSSGNELWVARYNGPGNSHDVVRDLAIDSSGNIYVTGMSYYIETSSDLENRDITTVSYDSDGNELWVARYEGQGNSQDMADDITIDPMGNIYVTGFSTGSGTYYDYITVAYDSSGNELWAGSYNGPGNGDDYAFDITVDYSSNVYVTGFSLGSGTSNDFATVAYDSSGNELWVARYNGLGNGNDYARAIVSQSGYIYVTGYSVGSGTYWDYTTIAYDSYGNELWLATYNGPGNGDDNAFAIAADFSGNIYVTGRSHGTDTLFDYATIKYSHIIPKDTIEDLIKDIKEMHLPDGLENSLISKLENALGSLEKDLVNAAINKMESFINQVEAQRGKKLTEGEADALIEAAQAIIDNLYGDYNYKSMIPDLTTLI